MNFALGRDLAQLVDIVPALAHTNVTAGGSGDATDANGVSIDQAAAGRQKAECITFVVVAEATLASAQTLSNAIRVQDSANGSSWADVVDPRVPSATFSTAATSAAGVATNQTVAKLSVPTEYLRQYVRVVATPNLSASGTDTARLQGVAILSGLAKV